MQGVYDLGNFIENNKLLNSLCLFLVTNESPQPNCECSYRYQDFWFFIVNFNNSIDCWQRGRVDEIAVLIKNAIETVSIQNLLASFFCFLKKAFGGILLCLAVFASSSKFQLYHQIKTKTLK